MKVFFLFLTLLLSYTGYGQDRILKEMGWDKHGASGKTKIIDKYLLRIEDSCYVNPRWSKEKALTCFQAAQKIEYYDGQVHSLLNACKSYIYLNEFDSSLHIAQRAIRIADKAKDPTLQIQSHNAFAGVLSYMGKYDLAADEYFLTLRLAEKHDKSKALIACANLGHVFNQIGNHIKSREYSVRAHKMASKEKDTTIMLMTLNLIGLADYHEEKFQDGLKHYNQALALARAQKNIEREAQILFNIANIYMELEEFDKALDLYAASIEASKSSESYHSIASSFMALSEVYLSTDKIKEAKPIIDSALRYIRLSEDPDLLSQAYRMKSLYSFMMGKSAEAYRYLDTAYMFKDSSVSLQLNQTVLSSEEAFNKQQQAFKDSVERVQQKLKEDHQRSINDQKIRSREILLWISGLALLLVIFGLSRLYKNNRLIRHQKEEIQGQHKEIKDSIQYALRIQQATLPKAHDFNRISPDNFVFFAPKDVVSGDFYWMYIHEPSGLKIWAVADCTGHGVPGGFMSMLGIGLLNEIVVDSGNIDPGSILNELRHKILASLNQSNESDSRDGMDIGLCAWDPAKKLLHFAGANNPLWLLPQGALNPPEMPHKIHMHGGKSLLEILPDKMPIGFQRENPPPFHTRTLQVNEGDMLVLFSDGFADQFGGTENKKFRYQTMRTLLLDHSTRSMQTLGKEFERNFTTWKGSEAQTDDVCVVGIRLT